MIKGIKVCSAFYAKTFGHSYDYINQRQKQIASGDLEKVDNRGGSHNMVEF